MLVKKYKGSELTGFEYSCDEDLLELLKDLYDSHDKYYEFSDDHRVYMRGLKERVRIQKVLNLLENKEKGKEILCIHADPNLC